MVCISNRKFPFSNIYAIIENNIEGFKIEHTFYSFVDFV